MYLPNDFVISEISRLLGISLEKANELFMEFEKNNRSDIYWDDIPMFLHFDSFNLGINVMSMLLCF